MADPAVDEMTYEDKGVFFSNFQEVLRVIKVVATRILNLESKVGGISGGTQTDPAIQALPKTVNDLVGVVAALKDEADKTYAKLNKLFPDEVTDPPNIPDVPQKVPDVTPPADKPVEDKPVEDKPADDKPVDGTVVDEQK